MRNQSARRVAIVGGLRIPFCRSHTNYRHCSNQDMLTAVLKALVDRYAISKADAEQFAGVGGLTARDVDNTGGQR